MAITSRPRTRYPFNGTSTTSRTKCERWSKASGLSLHTSCPRSGAKNRQRRGDAAAARSWWSLGRVLINRDCSAIARCRKRRVRIAPEAQAIFFRRRHQPRRPPLAKMRPGRPAPAMGPGTAPIIENLPSIRLLLAQYPYNSFHDWHFEILFIVAIICQLIHILLEAL